MSTAAAGPTEATAEPLSAARLARTRAALEDGIAAGQHPGAQLYVSLPGQPGVVLALGARRTGGEDLDGNAVSALPMTDDTLMIWLSATKPITAVAIGQLWERGLLALDDPIAKHLPAFGAEGKERITIRHALTHTSGIRMLNLPWTKASWDDVIAQICRTRPEPRWIPGVHAGYHLGSSWFILGALVHRLDGRPFPQYVREAMFEPLGMRDAWIGMPADRHAAYGDRLAVTYNTEPAVEGSGPAQMRNWHRAPHVTACAPGGNGYGPLRELGRFYEMLRAGGTLDGARILQPQTVEAMTVAHRVGLYDKTFRHVLDWGLGFIVNSERYRAQRDDDALVPYGYGEHASPRTYGHSGFQSSAAFCDPTRGLVVACAVNGNPGEPTHTARFQRIVEAIYVDLGFDQTPAGL
ncbi:MAG: serine hydrolase domain-containing protein [Acidobacteriota bacterium]